MKAVILLLLSGVAFAGGDSGHAGPSSLIAPLVNVVILASFLIWKLKGPAKDFFTTKSTDVSNMMERAAIKAKEAQMLMAESKRKLEGAESEISKQKAESEAFINNFNTEYNKEVDERITELKSDAKNKIETEKNDLVSNLNNALLENVLLKAKDKLKNDKNLSDKATQNIIEGIK